MRADDVVELRKTWRQMSYGDVLPASTVLASRDWLAYVQAMSDAVPSDGDVDFPTEQDVLWAWPDGVAIVFSEPFDVQHAIISENRGSGVEYHAPSYEQQRAAAFAVMPPMLTSTRAPAHEWEDVPADAGAIPEQVATRPVIWISVDPTDVITGHWLPGSVMHPLHGGGVSQSSRLMLSLITALGHRLTRVEQVGARAERRRVERELPGLRVLQLATGASVQRSESAGTVEWTKRWLVRGHWRLQPYGPGKQQRKPIWIDPYVKGPEDKPLDVRQTIWRT